MKPLEDFQAPSLIFPTAVFLGGVGRYKDKGRRLVPASFDFGVNQGEKQGVVVTGNRRTDDVELERLRIHNRTDRA